MRTDRENTVTSENVKPDDDKTPGIRYERIPRSAIVAEECQQ
jgi:hypothetical protein